MKKSQNGFGFINILITILITLVIGIGLGMVWGHKIGSASGVCNGRCLVEEDNGRDICQKIINSIQEDTTDPEIIKEGKVEFDACIARVEDETKQCRDKC